MLPGFDHASNHDVAQVFPQRDEIIDRGAARSEKIAQLRRCEGERDERAQPLVRGVHRAIWYKNLTSES
jgi:hypothetical protein